MKRASIRVQEPTPELIEKIRRARVAISQQKPRYLKCPYCQHNAIAVYIIIRVCPCIYSHISFSVQISPLAVSSLFPFIIYFISIAVIVDPAAVFLCPSLCCHSRERCQPC